MADGRRREMRVADEDEYEDGPYRSIPPQGVQESPAEKKARIDRMIDVQLEALGLGRRNLISTRDHPENMIEVDLDFIQRRRRINQSGTAESRVAPETAEKLSLWNNAHASLKDDGTADAGLQDLAAGQTHRAKLMDQSSQDHNITRGQGDAGRRGSSRTRAGARGGRGGGVIGTRGRGTQPSRSSGVDIAPSLPRSPWARLPPVAHVTQASSSSTAIPSLKEPREQPRRRNEVPANVRELSTRHYDGRLATPSDFMASLTTHGLLRSTSLLDGPAEDEPITGGTALASTTEAAPLGAEVAAADALFKFIEGDAANAPSPSTSSQAEATLRVGDLQGLEMIKGSAPLKTDRDIIRSSPVESSIAIAPLKTEEKTKESEMWNAYIKMELHNLFPPAKKGTAQKQITEYFKATAAKETGRDHFQSSSDVAAVKGKDQANSSTSEADEGTAHKVPQSAAQRLQRTHDEFTKVVQNGFDPTNLIFTGSLSKSRWAPRERSATRGDPLSIVAPLTSDRDLGPGNTRVRTLPIQPAGSSGLNDSGAAVRQQHDEARGGVLATNPTRQLPAAPSATVAGRGRGVVAPISTDASRGFIKLGVGQSIWNRGGLSKKG